jgi:hypothetical protein
MSQYDNASPEKYFPERRTVEMFLQQKIQYPWALEENSQKAGTSTRSYQNTLEEFVNLVSGATMK